MHCLLLGLPGAAVITARSPVHSKSKNVLGYRLHFDGHAGNSTGAARVV